MEKTISVIIPVYNVQAYLRECLDSVLSQDYETLEVILIDDGSKDDSGRICDEYAAKDSRVRVIHQPNGGAGAAKNAGLRAATGEYLAFLDSDDSLEPGAYSHMVQLMQAHDADVVQCLLQFVFKNRSEIQCVRSSSCIFSVLDYFRIFPWDWTCALMTDKLFKRELFNGVFFLEGNIIDDEFFTYRGIMNARKIVYDDRVVYNYRQRKSSVMNSSDSKIRILKNRMDYQNMRRKNVSQRFPELKKLYYSAYIDYLILMTENPWHTEQTMQMLQERILEYLREPDWKRPGVRLLPKLICVLLSDTNHLMKKLKKPDQMVDLEQLFP